MINFKYYKLTTNFLQKVIEENKDSDKTIFLFPTNISKNIAKQKYQEDWEFKNNLFLTVSEFKKNLFVTDKPLLKEDKRVLLFYDSLSLKDKEKLGFKNYFQAIDQIQKYFEFWNEINEELVDLENIDKILEDEKRENHWQDKIIEDMIRFKSNYKNYINDNGYSDEIFLNKIENVTTLHYKKFNKIKILDQYYFTKLEKKVFKEYFNDFEIMVYFQLPKSFVNEENWEIENEISAKDLKRCNLEIFQVQNEFSMINHLIKKLDNSDYSSIIDFQFESKYYSKYFLPSKFKFNTQMNFKETSIFKILSALHKFVESFRYINDRKEVLIPINNYLEIVNNKEFCQAVMEDENRKFIQEQVSNHLQNLKSNDYKFIDLEGKFLKNENSSVLNNFFKAVKIFLKRMFKIRNLTEFIDFIYQPDEILLDKIITEKELNYTDIIEKYYNALGDLKSVENFMINKNWDNYFSFKKNHTIGISYASNFLKFITEYLKPKKIALNQDDDSGKIRITNLANTRNLSYKNMIFMNIIEKVLPSSPKIPFIFSENQREKLGLLTYEKIRKRDKYYFYRMLAQTEKTAIYTIQNEDENIEISSFLEELRIDLPKEKIEWKKIENLKISNSFYKLFSPKNYNIQPEITKNNDFYRIPLNNKTDFPNNEINLSFSSWKIFEKNPFQFYFEKILRIEEVEEKTDNDYSHLFIGNFVHHLLNSLFERFNKKENVNLIDLIDNFLPKLYDQFFERNYLKKTYSYADFYFKKITIPLIIEGIKNFAKQLEPQFLKNDLNLFKILPETDKYQFKKMNLLEEISVNLLGKADLRIENPEGKSFIFDYKTGNSGRSSTYKEQLFIYKLIYYLIDELRENENVKAYLYYVYDHNFYPNSNYAEKKLDKEFSKFLTKMRNQIKSVLTEGFFIGEKTFAYEDKELLRRDLYSVNYQEEKGKENE